MIQGNLDGLIFAADIEKAIDSIEHDFLLATLTKYGFRSNFTQSIKTLFQIGDIEIKLSAFADDTTFSVRNKESLNRIERILENFLRYMRMLKNVKLVGLGVQIIEQTSQLIVKLPPLLEVQ